MPSHVVEIGCIGSEVFSISKGNGKEVGSIAGCRGFPFNKEALYGDRARGGIPLLAVDSSILMSPEGMYDFG